MTGSRTRWTRASFEAACLVLGLGLAGCGGQPQLIITLTRDPALAASPPFVKLHLQALDQPGPDEAGPFDVTAIPSNLFEAIPPGTALSIDVFGCQTAAAELCQDDISFTARGCTDHFITLTKAEGQQVSIELHKAADGAAICPTLEPGASP